jgi:predicted transcriptional regulator
VRTWLSVRSIFNNNEKKGYLIADGKPLSYQTLARITGDRNPNNVKRDIEELVDIGIPTLSASLRRRRRRLGSA